MSTGKSGMFVTNDGKNLVFTFILVSSLFLLWGACNGMIDVMDKHFQDELDLTKSQSAWVQFAHYLGYFLMAMPAGWLATRLGYKGGIIAGLLMVAVGGFWFLEATHINELAQAELVSKRTAFLGFLAGVCTIAAGLTFLETVANPYTTVLGPKRYAATRINLAQSCNGIGWICGPTIGAVYFYSTDAAGLSTGSQTLYIPYVAVGVLVLLLSVVFYFANMPDIKTDDDYHLEDNGAAGGASATADRKIHRVQVYWLMWLNAAVLVGVFALFAWLIVSAFDVNKQLVGIASSIASPLGVKATVHNALVIVLCAVAAAVIASLGFVLIPVAKKISHHSIWSHAHFSGATFAQFTYVAAQAGIFSFLINYMTEEPPSLPAAWQTESTKDYFGIRTKVTKDDIKDLPSFADRLTRTPDAVSVFLSKQLSEETKAALAEHAEPQSDATLLRILLAQDLNKVVKPNPKKGVEPEILYNPQRFDGVKLGEKTKQLLSENPEGDNRARLNRMLLADAYPGVLAYNDGFVGITDKLGALFVTFGFFCFFIGRFTGANLLKKYSAHKVLGLYALMNVVACFLVFLKLGWLSVVCVFLSYLFMSIMFPTIFALGIFGLGPRTKTASAFIVMAIMGGAILPKLMGQVADYYDMSRGFIVPMACFVLIALYGFFWPKLSNAESLHGVGASSGH